MIKRWESYTSHRLKPCTCCLLERIQKAKDYVEIGVDAGEYYRIKDSEKEADEKALGYADLSGGETVWDLYCGIGTISLFLAKKAGKVYGVEIVEEAIEDAKRNAALNDIQNAEFYAGKSEEILPEKHKSEGVSADVIVVDPPRKGCDAKLLDTILSLAPKRVVYVSCDPATLARDVRILTEGGYALQKACAFDNFGQTGHVETCCLLERLRNAKEHISFTLDMEEYYRIKDGKDL